MNMPLPTNTAQRILCAERFLTPEQRASIDWAEALPNAGGQRVIGRPDLYIFGDDSMLALCDGKPVEYIGGIA